MSFVRHVLILVAITGILSGARECAGSSAIHVLSSSVLPVDAKNFLFRAQAVDAERSSVSPEIAASTARNAREQAQRRGDTQMEVAAALDEARAIELWAAVDKRGEPQLPEAISAYKFVIERGSVGQRAIAQNNLGVLLLRNGDAPRALEVFQSVDLNSIAATDVYLYQFNFGRSLELNRDAAGALVRYINAIDLRPDFTPAVDGAFRILWKQNPPPVDAAVGVANTLIRNGMPGLAREQLKHSLSLWNGEPHAVDLLGDLVRSYEAMSFTPPRFNNEDLPLMRKLDSSALRLGVQELRIAYSGDFLPSFDVSPGPFKYWGGGSYRRPFAKVLKLIGDYYSEVGNYHAALACYSNSWSEGRLPDAALFTATLLRNHHELDPQGQVLNRLIESLTYGKEEAFAEQDWVNILRLHAVLATIYERQEQWGTSENPRGVIFQWEHALAARSVLQSETDKYPPSPNLDMHLANSYRAIGRVEDAQREYIAAAKGFDQAHDPEGASKAYRYIVDIKPKALLKPQQREARIEHPEGREAAIDHSEYSTSPGSGGRMKNETIDATAYGTNTQMGRNVGVTLIIYDWSTPEDREILIEAFQKGQNQGLVNALQKMQAVGHSNIPGTLGYDVSFIRLISTSTGRKIRFVTSRKIAFGEAYADTQSQSFNLTAGEMDLNDQDKSKSTGVLYPAAQFTINKDGELQIELNQ